MEDFYKELDDFIESLDDKKNDYKILSFVVDRKGYISEEIINYIAKKIDMFPFSLEGTIKFYPKLQKATTKHYIQICVGRNCGRKDLKDKIQELREKTGFIIEERNCLGHCGRGSTVTIGDEVFKYNTLNELEKKIINLK